MDARKLAVLICGGALAALPMLVAAQVYKWVDERGVVNYSQTPPKGAKTTQVEDSGRLTVVPAPPKQPVATTQAALQNRVDRLERELDDERYRAQQATTTRDQQLQAWRERCRNEKWADCDDERALVARYSTDPRWGYGGYYSPYGTYVAPPIARPRPPLGVVPPTPAPPPNPPAAMARTVPGAAAPPGGGGGSRRMQTSP